MLAAFASRLIAPDPPGLGGPFPPGLAAQLPQARARPIDDRARVREIGMARLYQAATIGVPCGAAIWRRRAPARAVDILCRAIVRVVRDGKPERSVMTGRTLWQAATLPG